MSTTYIITLVALISLVTIGLFIIWGNGASGKKWWLELFGIFKTGAEQSPSQALPERDYIMEQTGTDNLQKGKEGVTAKMNQSGKQNKQIIE